MNNEIQFILYQLPDEEGKVQVVVKDETIGLTVGHPCRLAPSYKNLKGSKEFKASFIL